MRRVAILALSVLLAAPAAAQAPMTAEEFGAYATGKTLIYGDGSGPYGIEEYLEGRRVRWSFLDGDCVEGVWYPQGDAICFAYEGRAEPECWYFYREETGLRARPSDSPSELTLYEISRAREPMTCKGPRVGV